jgi:hypothetical protein
MSGPASIGLTRLRRAMMAVWLLACLPVRAQPVPEHELKAAFVYNFALFTEWPGDTVFEGGTLNICVTSRGALSQPLVNLSDRLIKNRKVAIRHFVVTDSLRGCQVLYLDAADRERWPQLRKELDGASVLTVSDDAAIGHEGGIITLATDGNRVVFDIDTRAARQAHIVISSRLLRLARTVQ